MKKIAVIALGLSLAWSGAYAQTTPVVPGATAAPVAPATAPTVVIAGGLAGSGILLALLPLLLLGLLGGGNGGGASTTTTHRI